MSIYVLGFKQTQITDLIHCPICVTLNTHETSAIFGFRVDITQLRNTKGQYDAKHVRILSLGVYLDSAARYNC